MNKTAELQSKITNIYNHLYANAGVRTPHGIANEVGKVLHTASFIEKRNNNSQPAFLFTSRQIKDNLNGHAGILAKKVQQDYQIMNVNWQFYEDTHINLNDFDLAYTCCQLSGVLVTDKQRDVFGDAIEIFRGRWAKQVGGQFFTDGLVTKLAMNLLDFNPQKGDDLVDICAGTGGFLLAGLNHIRQQLERNNLNKDIEKELVQLARKSLKGQEIDKEVCRIGNATLISRLGKSKDEFIQHGNSLSLSEGEKIKFSSHYCIASNPPFGTKITIKDHKILEKFDLAKVSSRTNTFFPIHKIAYRSPDILFVEQNVKLLVPNKGRLAIVLPYQILSGPQTMYVRDWLLKHTIIQAVIDLPTETFQPHTGTKTCLLILRRRKKPLNHINEVEDYSIFMSIPKWIGHDRRGKPVYKKNIEGKSTNEILTDFPQVFEAFTAYKNGKPQKIIHNQSFVISSKAITDAGLLQFNAQYHKPSKFKKLLESNENWNFVKLEDVVKKIFYPGRFKRNYIDYSEDAIPFFGGSDILQLRSWTNKWISPHHPKLNELAVKKDWVLITRSGSTGIVSMVPEAWDGFAMSEHIIRIIPEPLKLSPYYLMGFLRSAYCQEIIAKGVFGSVIDEINPNFIGKIKIPIPKSNDQLNKIIKNIALAEEARNQAIIGTKQTIHALDRQFSIAFAM